MTGQSGPRTWPALAPPPVARRGDVVDDHHGELVADPYRWLEDTDAPETAAWVHAQNARTESFLAAVPERDAIRARLAELWDYPRWGVPVERGGRSFQLRNSGLQDQPVLYVTDPATDPAGAGPATDPAGAGPATWRTGDAGDGARVLLDPNVLSDDGTVAVSAFAPSEDGILLAYATSAAGSDWMTWHVRDVTTGEDLDDVVEWSKFSTAAWLHDGSGFYYGAMARPASGEEHLAESRLLRVCLHRVGTPQEADELVFEAPDEPEWLPGAEVSDDGRYLVVTVARGTFPESQVHVLDLEDPAAGFRPLVADFASAASYVTNLGEDFYLRTDHGAERGRVVVAPLGRTGRESWTEVVPETGDTLLHVVRCGDRLVCHYLRDAHARVVVHALGGPLPGVPGQGEIPLPGFGSLTGLEGRPGSTTVQLGFTSFTESGVLLSHDLVTATTTVVRRSAARISPEHLVTEQVFAVSGDGTRVPLFLTRRRDVLPDGDVPVLLYGYGGFDVPVTPAFSATHATWTERGGLLAVAVLRGGGEYGRSWYDAGRLEHKQNVFDDFCACARHLVASGWTRPERIAANGASNGGLLVGACCTQHPELYGAAVPEVGVLDMLRFTAFTIGWAWTSDYGDPADAHHYRFLRSWSPLHNVRPGTSYPATMVMTGDHDDRVVPGHSFKFAAALQAAQAGDAPVLLRVETSAGHGAGKPTAKLVAERSDFLTFLEATVAAGRDRPDDAR